MGPHCHRSAERYTLPVSPSHSPCLRAKRTLKCGRHGTTMWGQTPLLPTLVHAQMGGTYQRVCPPPPFLYPRLHLCANGTRKTQDDMVTSPLSYPPRSRAIGGCMTKSTMLNTRHIGTGAFRVFARNTFREHPTRLPSHMSTHGGRCATSRDVAAMSALPTTLALVMGALFDIWCRTCFSYHHYPIQAYLPALYLHQGKPE